MLDLRNSLIKSTLNKVLQRLHYPLEVMLRKYGVKTRGQVFHYEIATLSQLHNPANTRVMQANACEFESEGTGHSDILAKYDNERPDPFSCDPFSLTPFLLWQVVTNACRSNDALHN